MTASVIIPHLSNTPTLQRTLDSIRKASQGLDVQILTIEDKERRGAAWGRNVGLDRATGDVIFFADADDTVNEGFFREPMAEIEKTGADLCFFEASDIPLSRDYNITGNANIRKALFSAFLGYSFENVRRWNAGGSLWHGRDLGYIWRVAFRRSFIARHALRFDMAMRISDDATFLSECALYAERTASIRSPLYNYEPTPTGIMGRMKRSRVRWNEKFASKAMRERIDILSGGEAWQYCEASCALAGLEMLRCWHRCGLSADEAWRGIRDYYSDSRAREALRKFPISWRHPLAAAGISLLRFSI